MSWSASTARLLLGGLRRAPVVAMVPLGGPASSDREDDGRPPTGLRARASFGVLLAPAGARGATGAQLGARGTFSAQSIGVPGGAAARAGGGAAGARVPLWAFGGSAATLGAASAGSYPLRQRVPSLSSTVYDPQLGQHGGSPVSPTFQTRNALGGSVDCAGGGGSSSGGFARGDAAGLAAASLSTLFSALPQGAFGNTYGRDGVPRRTAGDAFTRGFGDLFGARAEKGAAGGGGEDEEEEEEEEHEPDPDLPAGDPLKGFGDLHRLQLFRALRRARGVHVARSSFAPCVSCSCVGESVIACMQCGTHCAACDVAAHASSLDHARTLCSRSSALAAAVSASRLPGSAPYSVPFVAPLGTNERVVVGGHAGGAGGGALVLSSVVLPYPYQMLRCPSVTCSGVLVPYGPPMAQQITVYSLASAAVVSRHAEGKCSVCFATMRLHPVFHLHLNYYAGSPVSPGQVYSHSFLDAFSAMRLVKPSLGTNTAVEFWLELTRSARELGVPMPPQPRNAALAVALLEHALQRRLQSVESGAFLTCPQCPEVQGHGAVDGEYKCDQFKGPHVGSPSYTTAMNSTISAACWVSREHVVAAEAQHPAQKPKEGDRSCGGASREGVHVSTRSAKSSNGVVISWCEHLFGLAFSDLALGEKFSQLAIHWHLWQQTVAGQRETRRLATSLVAHVVPLQAALAAGGHVGHGVFASAVAFLTGTDIAMVAPLLIMSPDELVVRGAGGGGGGAWGARAAGAAAGPAAPITAGPAGAALARAPAPGGQGATGRYRGAAELCPPDTVAPFEPDLPKFLQLHSRIGPRMSSLSTLFADSLCGKLGNYLAHNGLLDDIDVARAGLNKFHSYGHMASCLPLYTDSFCRGMGASDGEYAERGNARYSLISHPTRTMGPALRGAAFALDAGDYSAARALRHSAYLERQCVLALRRLHFADEEYARVLLREAASTRLPAAVLHARVPAFIADMLERYRALDDASAGVAPATITRLERLQEQLGKERVRVLSLQFFLSALGLAQGATPAMAAALADFDAFRRTKDMQGSLPVLRVRLAKLRASVAELQRRVKAKGGATGDDVTAVAYNTGCYRKALVAVMDLLQRLKEGYAVRGGLAFLSSPTATHAHVTKSYCPLPPHPPLQRLTSAPHASERTKVTHGNTATRKLVTKTYAGACALQPFTSAKTSTPSLPVIDFVLQSPATIIEQLEAFFRSHGEVVISRVAAFDRVAIACAAVERASETVGMSQSALLIYLQALLRRQQELEARLLATRELSPAGSVLLIAASDWTVASHRPADAYDDEDARLGARASIFIGLARIKVLLTRLKDVFDFVFSESFVASALTSLRGNRGTRSKWAPLKGGPVPHFKAAFFGRRAAASAAAAIAAAVVPVPVAAAAVAGAAAAAPAAAPPAADEFLPSESDEDDGASGRNAKRARRAAAPKAGGGAAHT